MKSVLTRTGLGIAMLSLSYCANALYPIGGFDQYNNWPVYIRWPFTIMDVNGDGDISGDDEGVEITIESGQLGFKADEIVIVKEGFDVWETVPSAYPAFRFTRTVTEPLEADAATVDFINYVCIATEGDPGDQTGAVGGGVLGVTLLTFAVDATTLTAGDVEVPVSKGQILEADLVIDGATHRVGAGDGEVAFELLSTMVHEVGHVLGLGHDPNNNFTERIVDGEPNDVEREVFAMRDRFGQLTRRGITPTMYPFAFYRRPTPILLKTENEVALPTVAKTLHEAHETAALDADNGAATEVVFYRPHTGEVVPIDTENPPSWIAQRPKKASSKVRGIDFTVSFEDVELHNGIGFDHPDVGAARRAIVEDVLDYFDDVLDEDGGCDIVFEASVVDSSVTFLAAAGPTLFRTVPGYTNGIAFTHITTGEDVVPDVADIGVVVNFAYFWNATLEEPSQNEFDLFTVLVHEITHGLGFLSLIDETNGASQLSANAYSVYDSYLENGLGVDLLDELSPLPTFLGVPADLLGANAGLFFMGPNAIERFGDGPPVYAPDPFEAGSSVSHLDLDISCRAIMEPSVANGVMKRQFSPAEIGVLQDMGYENATEPSDFRGDCIGALEIEDGGVDLAPADVSGITFLYPRGDQDKYFEIRQEARTQTRIDFPSLPIAGGVVTAWCDHDDDPKTKRIPLFSTLTGLYENTFALNGRFILRGLWKEMEKIKPGDLPGVDNGERFTPTYVLTLTPLNGLDASGEPPSAFDSMHQGAGVADSRDEGAYTTQFYSEVFHLPVNLENQLESLDEGTPLIYDPIRRQIVVLDGTGRILEQVLPGRAPMFGDEDQTCPLNVVTATGTISARIPNDLRRFRDSVLFESAIGTALVDAYYTMAPSAARFVTRYTTARQSVAAMINTIEWLMDNFVLIGFFVVAGAGLLVRQIRRRRAVAIWLALFAGLMLSVSPAHALLKNMSTPEMVEKSENILLGKVSKVDSHWTDDHKRIVTDVTLTVDENVKGRLNKGAELTFRQLGGRVDGIVTLVPEYPRFTEGEETVLFMENRKDTGYFVVCGSRGKYDIVADAKTGRKIVRGATPEATIGLRDVLRTLFPNRDSGDIKGPATKGAKESASVTLDEYLRYLRKLVSEQASQQKARISESQKS